LPSVLTRTTTSDFSTRGPANKEEKANAIPGKTHDRIHRGASGISPFAQTDRGQNNARGGDNRRIRAPDVKPNHLYPAVSADVMRATETAHWLEWRDWGNPIIAEPFEVKDGFIHVPDRPANGIAWNEEAVRRYAY
jgi:hypothetical protein